MNSNVSEILARQSRDDPDGAAITQRRCGRDVILTYAQLEQAVRRESRRLTEAGIIKGDRVLVLCSVSLELYVAMLALLRCGGTAMFADPGAGLARLNTCCERAQPRAVIATWRASLLRPFVPALRWGPRWLTVPKLTPDAAGAVAPPPATVEADHPAMLTFTSGSTGEPRGMVRTHCFLARQQRAVVNHLGLRQGQTDLSTMPIFVLANLAAGVHSVLADVNLARPGAAAPQRLIAQIVRHAPDRMLASPAMFDRLADYCIMRGIVLESLQRIDTGGAPVFPRTIDKLRAVMPHAHLMIVYGSTEAEPIATLDATVQNDTQRVRIAGGAGLPAGACASDVQVRLLAARWGEPIGPLSAGQFNAQCVEPGVVGEIVVRGDRVIGGYLNGVGDSQTKFHVDGSIWHRTGDLGRFDDEGQLWLLGRAAAQLRDQRGAIEPLAVEAAAMEQAALACCALVAIRGERVLVVQIAADAEDGWRERLLDDLAWAQIGRVMTLRRIPLDRRHNAKIDYPSLRRMVGADSPSALSTTRAVPAAPSISTRSPS